MVLLSSDVTSTIRASLLALLIVQVWGYVSEEQVALKDMECKKKEVREHVGGVDTARAEAEYEECKKELNSLIYQYVEAQAKHAHMTKDDWLSKNSYRFDRATNTYVLAVSGGRSESQRFVYIPRSSVFVDEYPISRTPETTSPGSFDNNFNINDRYLRLKGSIRQ